MRRENEIYLLILSSVLPWFVLAMTMPSALLRKTTKSPSRLIKIYFSRLTKIPPGSFENALATSSFNLSKA